MNEKKNSEELPNQNIVKVGSVKSYVLKKSPVTKWTVRYPIFYTYKDIFYNDAGWADVEKYLPEDFDLVSMLLENKRIINGWINGLLWEGLRLKSTDKVLFWKKIKNEELDLC